MVSPAGREGDKSKMRERYEGVGTFKERWSETDWKGEMMAGREIRQKMG